MNPKQKRSRDLAFYLLILVIVLCAVYMLTSPSEQAEELTFSQIIELFEDKKVEAFTVEGSNLILNIRNEEEDIVYELYDVDLFNEKLGALIDEQLANGTLTEYDYKVGWVAPWWMSMIPYMLMMFLLIGVWWFMMNKAGGGAPGVGKFGKARTKNANETTSKVTFKDVAGADEEKAELEELVDFLKNPRDFSSMGARIPKGVLLVGPPGTGKTLLAKAVAGEAGVQFLSISGSDFVELYVGVGASRVRDLFEQAKKVAPCIIFIDEIDAVGRQRGSGLGGGHDEREQTLNQLLVEMDGFEKNSGVIVMAATNRADILDNALLRPGRFDRRIYVGVPDVKGREAILKVHAKGKPLGDDVDLKNIARGTPGFTGADLENLLNEAALLAVRRKRKFIMQEDIDEAILKVEMGPEKKSHVITDKERRLTAYHEAGHAIAGRYLKNTDPVHYITIIPRGGAGGFTLFRPDEDRSYTSKQEMLDNIVMALGGRVAEQLFLDDISTGASGDIHHATDIARKMITVYGMSERLGPICYDSSDQNVFIGRSLGQTKSYSEETAAVIDEEVKKIFDESYARCMEILKEHEAELRMVADYLLVHESMEGADFAYICEYKQLPIKNDGTIEPAAKRVAMFSGVPELPAEEPATEEAPAQEAPSETNE
ncbi:MAG: ATP-dependent zinc metalloprotease FtsH [Oscillospiraceae bacterium]|nr:ATP-dependent zinc metalloprotease FtsH [Oscillospiraceae bacterium]